MRWSVLVLLLVSLGGFMAWAGCKGKHSVTPNLKQLDIQLVQGTSDVTGINYIVNFAAYAGHVGPPIPCGSEDLGGGQPILKAGLLWFDMSQVSSNAQVYEATLVLTVNEAPSSGIEVELRDLSVNPMLVNPNDPTQCQNAYDDACSGKLYATINVDASQTTVEVPLGTDALTDIENAISAGTGFGIGLRAPSADASNIVPVSFKMDVYIRLKYR